MEYTVVKFVKSYDKWVKDDIATFDPERAQNLIDGKVAVAYEEPKKAKS